MAEGACIIPSANVPQRPTDYILARHTLDQPQGCPLNSPISTERCYHPKKLGSLPRPVPDKACFPVETVSTDTLTSENRQVRWTNHAAEQEFQGNHECLPGFIASLVISMYCIGGWHGEMSLRW